MWPTKEDGCKGIKTHDTGSSCASSFCLPPAVEILSQLERADTRIKHRDKCVTFVKEMRAFIWDQGIRLTKGCTIEYFLFEDH